MDVIEPEELSCLKDQFVNLDELKVLIGRAGYALTHASKLDIIVEYFIGQGIYDLFQINEVLFAFDQPLLGGRSF